MGKKNLTLLPFLFLVTKCKGDILEVAKKTGTSFQNCYKRLRDAKIKMVNSEIGGCKLYTEYGDDKIEIIFRKIK